MDYGSNHFEILYPIDYNIPIETDPFEKETLLEKYNANIHLGIKKNNNTFFEMIYVEYPRGNQHKYNDIFKFLKNLKTPEVYDNIKDAKKRHKKRNLFRKDAKSKYKIYNNRLYYKYYFQNRSINKKADIITVLHVVNRPLW